MHIANAMKSSISRSITLSSIVLLSYFSVQLELQSTILFMWYHVGILHLEINELDD